MQLSFSLLAVATAFAALVSAHPAQQLKRVTTTTPTSTTALALAGIPTHASTVSNALPAAINTTPPSSCTFPQIFFHLYFILNLLITNYLTVLFLGGSGPPGAAIKGRILACPNAW